jgi:hypothetical protein
MKPARPSIFTCHPWNSVIKKAEGESVARNIMMILKRTGDIFRPLPWEEYKAERIKDGNFSETEKAFFEMVIDYCKSEDTAKLFSKSWSTTLE